MNALKFTNYFIERGHFSGCLCQKGSELHLNLSRQELPYFALTLFSRYSLLAMLRIREVIRKSDFQIVHLHNPRDLWLISPALLGLGRVKLFATSRIFFTRQKKLDPLHRLLYTRLEKMIDTTALAQKHMRANLPLPAEKHLVIPNPVDLSRFDPGNCDRNHFRSRWQVEEDEFLIGLVGRIDPGKGQKEMISALPRISSEFFGVKLVLVGEETYGEHQNYVAELKSLAENLKVGNRVIWAGFQTDIPEVLKALDLLVMPSYQESFGSILVEAMAMRLPTVAANSGGPPEILEQGNCGLLVPPRQAEPLAEAVLKYLKDENLRNRMASAGRKRVEQVYSLDVVLGQLEQLYYQSLGL